MFILNLNYTNWFWFLSHAQWMKIAKVSHLNEDKLLLSVVLFISF